MARGSLQDVVPAAVVTACRSAVRGLGESVLANVGVTSTRRREGRTTVALGLALVMREEFEDDVVVLELDVERPALAERLGLERSPGLAEWQRNEVDIDGAIQWTGAGPGVIHAGSATIDAERLWTRFGTTALLSELAAAGHRVIADLPPLTAHDRVDRAIDDFRSTIFVVRAGQTPVDEIRSAVRRLAASPAVILNGKASAVPRWLRATGVT
jgi:Mrp family chromosome partitioning ATPase